MDLPVSPWLGTSLIVEASIVQSLKKLEFKSQPMIEIGDAAEGRLQPGCQFHGSLFIKV